MSKTRTKTRPKPAQRRRAPRSTALVKAKTKTPARVQVLPAEGEERRIVNAEGMDLGALGLIELKLTPAEEKVLNEPVDVSRVLWRERVKDGPPEIPYLPHQDYTRWFNRAFGRLGWALVPIGKPSMTPGAKDGQQTITCPYVLHVHGKPVAFAMGEQEYFSGNKQQTYGDALESTVGNALRRCAKRLGVGLELWDRDWKERHMPPEARRPAPPERRSYQAPREDAPVAHNPKAAERISEPQYNRLRAIVRNSGRDEQQVRDWLYRTYRINTAKDLTRRDYDYVCKAIESPADLPERS